MPESKNVPRNTCRIQISPCRSAIRSFQTQGGGSILDQEKVSRGWIVSHVTIDRATHRGVLPRWGRNQGLSRHGSAAQSENTYDREQYTGGFSREEFKDTVVRFHFIQGVFPKELASLQMVVKLRVRRIRLV